MRLQVNQKTSKNQNQKMKETSRSKLPERSTDVILRLDFSRFLTNGHQTEGFQMG